MTDRNRGRSIQRPATECIISGAYTQCGTSGSTGACPLNVTGRRPVGSPHLLKGKSVYGGCEQHRAERRRDTSNSPSRTGVALDVQGVQKRWWHRYSQVEQQGAGRLTVYPDRMALCIRARVFALQVTTPGGTGLACGETKENSL